jgi:putative MFS transporter
MQQKQYGIFSLPVIVGALGFFVDIYDLLLFNVVRRSSFTELGVPEELLKTTGETFLSWQMIGLAIGGIAWGILGDKKGRKTRHCCHHHCHQRRNGNDRCLFRA